MRIILLTLIMSFSFTQGFLYAQNEEKINATMNAFMEFKNKGYSDVVIQEGLKKIIDGDGKFEGNQWEEFIKKFESMGQNSQISRGELYKFEIAIIEAKKMVVNELMAITNNAFLGLGQNPIKRQDGSYYFEIPENISGNRKYLKIASDILLSPVKALDDHPDKEDLDKITVNLIRMVNLYDKSLEDYVKFLTAYNSNEKKQLKSLERQYKRSSLEYQIESQKIIAYISQKGSALSRKYLFRDEYDTIHVERLMMELEKNYEKKY